MNDVVPAPPPRPNNEQIAIEAVMAAARRVHPHVEETKLATVDAALTVVGFLEFALGHYPEVTKAEWLEAISNLRVTLR